MSRQVDDSGSLAQPASISLVGNGPVSQAAAHLIDKSDLVVRINRANLCGAAGRRTDVIVLFHRTLHVSIAKGMPINPRAAARAREFWVSHNAEDARSVERLEKLKGSLFGGRAFRIITLKLPVASILASYGASNGTKPSTGAGILAYILEAYPEAKTTLFGFSHRGDAAHDWAAERRWMDDLVAQERISRAPASPPYVNLPTADVLCWQARRGFNHLLSLFGR